ncbi:MAG: hypothetical protein MR531_14550 [Lachnospiraceae bacterium]|nr:hypothetical protein [Lachnospiraceae bacterium]
MEYYRMKMNDVITNYIKIERLDTSVYKQNCSPEEFEKLPKGIVAYYHDTRGIEIPDVLQYPLLLVKENVKDILHIYDEQIKGKPIKVFAYEQEVSTAPTYWLLNYEEVDCLSEKVVVNPNGELRELILNKRKIQNKDVFRVKGTHGNYIVVSLAVVESMLRRQVYGVGFEKVKTDEEW